MAAIDLRDPVLYDGKFNVAPTWVEGQRKSMCRRIDTGEKNLLAANTYDIMTIGDADNAAHGYRIEGIACQCLEAEGTAATLDVGDEDSETRFDTDFDVNSATIPVESADALITYTAEKKIRIKPSVDLDTARFDVEIRYSCIDLTDTSS